MRRLTAACHPERSEGYHLSGVASRQMVCVINSAVGRFLASLGMTTLNIGAFGVERSAFRPYASEHYVHRPTADLADASGGCFTARRISG